MLKTSIWDNDAEYLFVSQFLDRGAERISVDHVAHLKPSDGGSAATQCKLSLLIIVKCLMI